MNSEKQSTNLQMTLREVNRVGEGQKNVPKLRFKGYEDAWEQRKLGTAIDVKSGKDYKHLDEGDVPVYGTGGYMLSVSEALENTRDAIGIGRKGTIDKPFVLKAPFWTVDTLFYCIPKENNSLSFLYSLFQSINWKLYDESTGVPSLSKTAIDGVTIKLTSEDEQSSIGECFESVDNLITLHQRKYDALKSMKKTLLSKMFPKNGEDVPEIRFKEFTDAWEQRKLGEIVLSEIKGSAKAEMIGGDTPYLETNYLNGGECLFVDSENNVDTDDVIVLWDGSQAGTVYHGFSGALGSTFKAYKTKCLGLFIFQQLKKNQQTIYDKYRTPNIPHVIKTFKDEYDVMLTSEEEQNEIGRYFQQIDHLITLHQRKLEELKNMKKTLLQQMFV